LIEGRLVDVVAVLLCLGVQLLGIENLVAEIGRKDDSDDPGDEQGDRHHGEDREGVFAGVRFGEADRHEAGGGNQRAGQHRERRRGIGEGRGAEAVPALLHLHHHHLDGDDRVVDEQTERDDQRAERNALQIDAEDVHGEKRDRQHERDRQGDHGARAQAEAEEGDRSTITTASLSDDMKRLIDWRTICG
jgi:hypothetical protein